MSAEEEFTAWWDGADLLQLGPLGTRGRLRVAFLAGWQAAIPNASILDGTVSCRVCRALVLETNIEAHVGFHKD